MSGSSAKSPVNAKQNAPRLSALQSSLLKSKSAAQNEPLNQPKQSPPQPNQSAPSQPGLPQLIPSQPIPSQQSPSQPIPSQPAPSQPNPSQPAPSQPNPSQPAPSQPNPSQPSPSSQPLPSDIEEWDENQCGQWVSSLGRAAAWTRYGQICKEKELDGPTLAVVSLGSLTKYGFEEHHAALVLDRVKKLKQQSPGVSAGHPNAPPPSEDKDAAPPPYVGGDVPAVNGAQDAGGRNFPVKSCPDHNQPYCLFCLDDRSLICVGCVTTTHKQHRYEDLSMVVQREKDEAILLVRTLEKDIGVCKQALDSVCEAQEGVARETEQLRSQVSQSIQIAHEMLDARFKELIKVADEQARARTEQWKKRAVALEAPIRNCATMREDILQIVNDPHLPPTELLSRLSILQHKPIPEELLRLPTFPSLVPKIDKENLQRTFNTAINLDDPAFIASQLVVGFSGLPVNALTDSSFPFTISVKTKQGEAPPVPITASFTAKDIPMELTPLSPGLFSGILNVPRGFRGQQPASFKMNGSHLAGSPYMVNVSPKISFLADNCSPNLRLDDGNMIVRKVSGDGGWNAAVLATRTIEFTVRILQLGVGYAMVGFAPASAIKLTRQNHHTCGWYLYLHDGSLHGQNGYKGQPFFRKKPEQGDRISCRLNAAKETINFRLNDEPWQEGFKAIKPADLNPAINFYDCSSVLELSE